MSNIIVIENTSITFYRDFQVKVTNSKKYLYFITQYDIIYSYMESFYKRVHIKLIELERKRSWLLSQTGIKASTWSSWETHGRVPPADRALAIADALGLSLEFLLSGRETAFDMRQSNPLVLQIFNQLKFLDDPQLREVLTFVNTMRLEGSRS